MNSILIYMAVLTLAAVAWDWKQWKRYNRFTRISAAAVFGLGWGVALYLMLAGDMIHPAVWLDRLARPFVPHD